MEKLTLAVSTALIFAGTAMISAQAQQTAPRQTATKPAASAGAQQKAVEDLQRASQELARVFFWTAPAAHAKERFSPVVAPSAQYEPSQARPITSCMVALTSVPPEL